MIVVGVLAAWVAAVGAVVVVLQLRELHAMLEAIHAALERVAVALKKR